MCLARVLYESKIAPLMAETISKGSTHSSAIAMLFTFNKLL